MAHARQSRPDSGLDSQGQIDRPGQIDRTGQILVRHPSPYRAGYGQRLPVREGAETEIETIICNETETETIICSQTDTETVLCPLAYDQRLSARASAVERLLSAVERAWHTHDSQGQILALAFR